MAYRATANTEQRKQEVHAAILKAGKTLVSEQGFRALSISAVAERAGIAAGTLYRYFDSKTALCVAIFAHATEREIQQTLAAVLSGDAGGVLDQCAALASLGTDWASFWKELMLAFRDHLEREARKGSPQETLRLARMLHLLLQRERDLRDASLPQVVVELALVTAAQLPHLAPLDALVRSGGGPASGPPPHRPEAGAAPRAAVPPAATPAAPVPAPPASEAELKQRCSEALRAAQGSLSRTLPSLPHLASRLVLEGGTLRFHFGPSVRNSAQELEREQANPNLIAALRSALPGLQRVAITLETAAGQRPEDVLREDPAFQRLIQAVGGEITQVRRDP